MDHNPCSHISEFRSLHGGGGGNPFLSLEGCLSVRHPGRAFIRRDPSELPRCTLCLSPTRLYACLSCASLSCLSHAPSHAANLPHAPTHVSDVPHAPTHLRDRAHALSRAADFPHAPLIDPHVQTHLADEAHARGGGFHALAVDVDRAELFCCVCEDQVYDRDFDAVVVSAQAGPRAENPEKLRKRRRVDYRSWAPDLRERTLIGKNATPLTPSGFPWGLRGLNNLGNTCFMNSVLQALLHTPPLRNYFLSDRHNRFYCQQQKNGVKKNDACCDKKSRVCLACDMDAMFSAVFSGDRMPYSPAKFLYSWWQHAANLASYEQQDAHEFFISMLDGIHEKAEKDKRKPQSHGSGECCIAHRVFSGILRSDVMCTACGFTSTTFDPCVDVSLDLEANQVTSTKSSSTKFHNSCNGKENTKNFTQNCEMATLIGCLDRFTKPEKLGSEQKFFCQQCQVRQESLKQMSIKKLPLVSCFHIKRFEHSPIRKMSRKIDRYLQFPFSLDMGPYMSSSILRSRFGNRIFSFDGDDLDSPSELSSEFELFAVITHSGKLDAGHYVTYLRLSNQWYKCDDAWITQVNENIVRAAQGYMMFYVQKMLYYKASRDETRY